MVLSGLEQREDHTAAMSSKNMFALLDDSSDDEAPKSKAAPAPAAAANKPAGNKERKPRAPREDNRKPRDEAPREDGERNQGKGGERRERSKGKGRKGGESRGDSGREYPRRSGTGRGRENSRSGGGKYNWGKEGDQQAPAEPQAEGEEKPEGAAPEAEVVEAEPEEENISFDEFEKQRLEKLANLNLNKPSEVREVEKDPTLVSFEHQAVEDSYACMFHDPTKETKKVSKKGRRGAKQADQVLNLKFVDESDNSGGKGKGGKGDRRKGDGKGNRSGGKGNQSSKSNIDLSNDMAFPTLGA
jgi:plasminogen activator inhibitor 1 RNA-binding protein